MDKLDGSHFLSELTGEVFLSQYQAWQQLTQSDDPTLAKAS